MRLPIQNFHEIAYVRPDFDCKGAALEDAIARFTAAGTAAEQSAALADAYDIRAEVETADMLNYIRVACDTGDAKLLAERRALNQAMPRLQALVNRLGAALLKSPFRDALAATWGPRLFTVAEITARVSRPEIADDLTAERELVQAYETLMGQASFTLEGEALTLSALNAILQDTDRSRRQAAHREKMRVFAGLHAEVDRIFKELVALRGAMARRLGYPSFTPMAYDRMQRSSYGPADVARLRDTIARAFVPLVARVETARAARLGLERLTPADEGIIFADGNPIPRCQGAELVDAVADIFDRFSPETAAFFRTLMDAGMLDLESRPGKAQGGFCEALPGPGLPFLFANFNGTSRDVDVLVHEGSHALQYFQSRHLPAIDLRWPSMDAAETSAMTMELFLLDYMSAIFGPDADRYALVRIHTGVTLLPYRCAIDAFQEAAYEADAPDFDRLWRDADRHFRPYQPATGDPLLEQGGGWIMQRHIIGAPFYFIDYNLADICAYRLWHRYHADPASTWKAFVGFCAKGGTLAFDALQKQLGLTSPFDPAAVTEARDVAARWLETRGFVQ